MRSLNLILVVCGASHFPLSARLKKKFVRSFVSMHYEKKENEEAQGLWQYNFSRHYPFILLIKVLFRDKKKKKT